MMDMNRIPKTIVYGLDNLTITHHSEKDSFNLTKNTSISASSIDINISNLCELIDILEDIKIIAFMMETGERKTKKK